MCLSWLEHHPVNQRVTGSILHQGTCVGGRFGPWSSVYWRQLIDVSLSHGCFSPSLSPCLSLSLESVSISLGEDKKDSVRYVKDLLQLLCMTYQKYIVIQITETYFSDMFDLHPQFLANSSQTPWNFLSDGSNKGVSCVNEVTSGPHPRVGASYY